MRCRLRTVSRSTAFLPNKPACKVVESGARPVVGKIFSSYPVSVTTAQLRVNTSEIVAHWETEKSRVCKSSTVPHRQVCTEPRLVISKRGDYPEDLASVLDATNMHQPRYQGTRCQVHRGGPDQSG